MKKVNFSERCRREDIIGKLPRRLEWKQNKTFGLRIDLGIENLDHIGISSGVARALIGGGGGVYSYIRVLPDGFLLK